MSAIAARADITPTPAAARAAPERKRSSPPTSSPTGSRRCFRLVPEVAPYLALPRGAVGRAKRLARSLGPRIDADVIEDTIRQLADAWEAEEAREGISAFLEKRKPRWAE